MNKIEGGAPVISVNIITYNHAAFIKQALDSVLEQKHNYTWEILIGDDCSTDETPQILKHYADRYPELIRIFLRQENIGYVKNTAELIIAAKGKYIATLDGDDYWIDPIKLQKQVDFLESNPGFAICFHNLKVIQGTNESDYTLYLGPDQKEITTIEDLCRISYIHPASCVYRNGLIKKLPDWYYNDCPINEWPINILNAEHGNIKYINEVMAVYRRHDGAYGNRNLAFRIKKVITVIHLLNNHFHGKYDAIFTQALIRCYNRLIDAYKGKNFFRRFYYALKVFRLSKKYHNYYVSNVVLVKKILNI